MRAAFCASKMRENEVWHTVFEGAGGTRTRDVRAELVDLKGASGEAGYGFDV